MESRRCANWPTFPPVRKQAGAPERGSGLSKGWHGKSTNSLIMEYDFLFDEARNLLAIGYNVGERRRDPSYYDLLASEARFCSFIAIAQGQLPQESWFALGRLLTTAGGEQILLSWSGSMFEYLMPLLVMPTYEHTLLDQTCKAAVARQIEYGRKRGVPWGSSESGYNAIDVHLNYQYRAFGVPGLGLKRGLADDLVIAPYAYGAGADGSARRGMPESRTPRGRRVMPECTASMRQSTTLLPVCPADNQAPWSVPSWLIIRA